MSNIMSRRDLEFLLYEVLDVEKICEREKFAEHGRDVFDPMLDAAEQIATNHFAACAETGDAQMADVVDGKVVMVSGAKAALDAFSEAGFIGAAVDESDGGLQLPATVTNACMAMFYSANIGLCGIPLLTVGVANLIRAFCDEDQQQRYLPPLLSGRFYGTMCLSEPHAGSSLTDIRTKAELRSDGTYSITGNKMWITGGEHEVSKNIVHMVLAKIPGGPPGVKGISMFLVPRYRVDDDGNSGVSNDVALAGLNHKMGQRITPNCLLNFGERGGCIGYLVGEPHRGLQYMFQMMNEARIGVGLSAASAAYAGYLHSLSYAQERAQGRLADNKDPESEMVPIIQHPDVKRMLLAQKAYAEGSLALCLYASHLFDEEQTHPDQKARDRAALLLDVLIPVVKAWPSEWGLEANKHAIQVLGGSGYTHDYPVERLYRDNRLNMIHEGTNGIHGLDLLGRKVLLRDGAGFKLLAAEIKSTIGDAVGGSETLEFGEALGAALDLVAGVTAQLVKTAMEGNTREFLANSSAYLDIVGHLVIGWLWVKQSVIAQSAMADATETDRRFYSGKIYACQYFVRWELSKIYGPADMLKRLDMTVADMPESAFSAP